MQATLVHYTLEGASPKQKTRIQRKLYGYKDYSNKGNYTYQRKGILEKILHINYSEAPILIFPKKESVQVINFLKKNHATVTLMPIRINESYFKNKK